MNKPPDYLQKINHRHAALLMCGLFALVASGLSILRAPQADETWYLLETWIITEALQIGEWFGNYGVALHGFLFKLPVAMAFLLTGPSAFVAALFTVILATLSGWLFYCFLRDHFGYSWWAVAGMALFLFGFEMLRSTPTYLREIPLVFSIILFLYLYLQKSTPWLIGLALLLLLDAKEYGFYIAAPAYIAVLWLEEYKRAESNLSKINLSRGIYRTFAGILPAFLLLFLSVTTSLVPINMYNAELLGLTKNGFFEVSSDFSFVAATTNQLEGEEKSIPSIAQDTDNERESAIIFLLNRAIGYTNKLLFPRTFSFIAIPELIALPSFVMSILLFRKWWDENHYERWILPFIFWLWLVAYILRASHGRYIFPIFPIFILFFIAFLESVQTDPRFYRRVVIAAGVFAGLSLFFEVTFVEVKLMLNLLLVNTLFVLVRVKARWASRLPQLYAVVIGLFVMATSVTSFAFMLNQGQLAQVSNWGIGYEADRILAQVDPDENIWINQIGWSRYPGFIRKDIGSINPEFLWSLADFIPKKQLLQRMDAPNTFSFDWQSIDEFRSSVQQHNITTIVLIVSTKDSFDFPYQGDLPIIERQPWTKLAQELQLKNKHVYIFDIVPADALEPDSTSIPVVADPLFAK
ncbi:MAG: hypothetical protein DWQ07_08940 [Chloroflexi bacterium]|nr:MAG: hypothetical protein DWQ07_08940 [Chloroflexota bacterium]MBL1193162.1 hypothetical protein [Chloroflexota bacterium]NOH10455.1 hypothetical protein [Chloroflexota bacterium]